MKRLILVSFFLTLAILPTFVSAQGVISPEVGAGTYNTSGNDKLSSYTGQGLVSCEGPDCNVCSLITMVNRVINWLIAFLSIAAVLGLVVAGFRMVISGGDSGSLEKAKEMFKNIVIGFILMLAAWLIIDTILLSVTGKGLSAWGPIDCGEQLGAMSASQPQAVGSTEVGVSPSAGLQVGSTPVAKPAPTASH